MQGYGKDVEEEEGDAQQEEETPNFEINPALEEYSGDPDDEKALAAHKKMVRSQTAQS